MADQQPLNFDELCAGYVLSSLTPEENTQFQAMLQSASAQEQQLFEDMKTIAAEMALLYPEAQPPEAIKQRLIEMAWASVNAPNGTNIFYLRRFRYAVAASLLFMVVSLALFLRTQNLDQALYRQGELLTEQENRILALQSEVQRKEELLTILEARDVDLILMDGLEVNPSGYGKIVWDKDNGQALLQVANLPTVPSDKDYQLWFIINNQPISAGVFAVQDPALDNFFKIEQLNQSEATGAFAITLEPKGGVPQPTGDMYMLGATSAN